MVNLNDDSKLITNQEKSPITILGAGISGLSAATVLGKSGKQVKVFERESHAGGRFDNDFHSIRNYGCTIDPLVEFTNFGINIKPIQKVNTIYRHSPSYTIEVFSEKPQLYIFARGKQESSIDNQLMVQAIDSGAVVEFNTSKEKASCDIIATGPMKALVYIYGEIYQDATTKDCAHVFLNQKYSPGAYLYLSPGGKKGECVVIALSRGELDLSDLKKCYKNAIKELYPLNSILKGATPICSIEGFDLGTHSRCLLNQYPHNGTHKLCN